MSQYYENYFGKSFRALFYKENFSHATRSLESNREAVPRVRADQTIRQEAAVSKAVQDTISEEGTFGRAVRLEDVCSDDAVSKPMPDETADSDAVRWQEAEAGGVRETWQLKVIDAQLLDLSRQLEMQSPRRLWRELNVDCAVLAALGAEAALNPQRIVEAVSLNSDHTISISFLQTAGRPDLHITVPVPSTSEFARFEAKSTFGLWPLIFHKAYEVWRAEHFDHAHASNLHAGVHESAARDSLVNSLELLTGESYCYTALRMYSEEELQTCIVRAFAAKLPLMVAILHVDEFSGELVPWHVYGLTEFNEVDSTLTVRDPWASRNGRLCCRPDSDELSDIGLFKVKLPVFRKQFDCISLPTALV